jgi:thiosulfate dehydrogenase (quinone) large subunit
MSESNTTKITLIMTRVTLGLLMLYAGFSKIIDTSWTAKGYLLSAKSFAGFYGFLASPALLPYVDFANKWALFFLGLSLITGLFLRLSGVLGALLMILYYFPVLSFPYVAHGLLIDEHLVYAAVLLYFSAMDQSLLATWQKIRKIMKL